MGALQVSHPMLYILPVLNVVLATALERELFNVWKAIAWFWSPEGSACTGVEPSAQSANIYEIFAVDLKETSVIKQVRELKGYLS